MKNYLNTFFKWATRSFFIFLLIILVVFNFRFYQQPDFVRDESGVWNEDVYEQLQFLKQSLQAGADDEMQGLFPEGHLFIHALYGLIAADFASATNADTFGNGFMEYEDVSEGVALRELGWACDEINSTKGKQVFTEGLPLPYGVFYRGWQNYLLAKQINQRNGSQRNIADFQRNADEIAAAFNQAPSPWLESYSESAWPADNVVAIASLAAYDRHFHTTRFAATISTWLEKVKQQLDPDTGLIPHATDPDTGAIREGARGSSQSLILSFLPEIDPVFAAAQYALYREHFLAFRLGRAGIREYPKGQEGSGDIDSGPVIWDIGGAASVGGQRAAGMNGDGELFADLRGSQQAFGFAFSWNGKRRYLFGKLPIADAFIGWANAVHQRENQFLRGPAPWRIHFISVLLGIVFCWLVYKI
ncbi:hypothetical protein [Neolewinella agarilytica]|uniref:hypothetical protein n=1 Tax=Neolewinella agarilytica TaxID=478744 RepID=UPI002357BE2B|nr:hypothetical protein [Neolewinella agarilytica]